MEVIGNHDAVTLMLAPLAIGLTEAAKQAGAPRWSWPLLSIVFGIAGAFLLDQFFGADIRSTVLHGIIGGLMGSGLWSGARTVASQDPTRAH